MAQKLKTVKDMKLAGKRVILRADYNVPISLDGKVADDYRIVQSLPTIQYLLGQDCRIVIISHLGRPEGKPDPKLSLEPVAERLSELLNNDVALAHTTKEAKSSKHRVTLLENLRFWPGEEANDSTFAKELSSLGEVFVQDGFGVVHRAHASTEAITKLLPSVAGLLLEGEVSAITKAMESPDHPLVAVLGGAKVSDKLELLHRFIEKADVIVIGGAMANTFLAAKGEPIGKSIYEPDLVDAAKEILDKAAEREIPVIVPSDVVVSKSRETAQDVRMIDLHPEAYGSGYYSLPEEAPQIGQAVEPDDYILDIGMATMNRIKRQLEGAKTIIWNGNLGVTEIAEFQQGSLSVAKAIIDSGAFSIIGGGDTVGFIQQQGLMDKFSHVSTGGGAALELMSGKTLPGLGALES